MKKKFFISYIIIFLYTYSSIYGARIKDITQFVGLQENILMGMGLVVGLNGTGDKSDASLKALSNLLKQYRFNVSPNQLVAGNIALVMVTAKLPPLVKRGSQIDVKVSSIGDAGSLVGGTLLTTYLKAINQKVYAVAQGVLSQSPTTLPTVAIVTNGAIVEREVPVTLVNPKGELLLRLNSPDINTANRIAKIINTTFKNMDPIGYAVNMASVKVKVPMQFRTQDKIAMFMAKISSLKVIPDTIAKVVINERTGTIIIGNSVSISPVIIAHNDITVQIKPDKPGEEIVTVEKLAQALFALQITPKDLVSIFRMLKQAGALHAKLIIK